MVARKNAERAIQRETVKWAKMEYPEIERIAASQNEDSYRNVEQGMDVGETDLRLYIVRRNIEHVLYLELKTINGKLSKSQIEWNKRFDTKYVMNRKRDVAYGFLQAKEKIKNWVDGINSL